MTKTYAILSTSSCRVLYIAADVPSAESALVAMDAEIGVVQGTVYVRDADLPSLLVLPLDGTEVTVAHIDADERTAYVRLLAVADTHQHGWSQHDFGSGETVTAHAYLGGPAAVEDDIAA